MGKQKKRKKSFSLLIILIILVLFSFILRVTEPKTTNTIIDDNVIAEMELPLIHDNDLIRYKRGFTLSYNPKHRQANWVAYPLTNKSIYGKYKRLDNFHEDETVVNPSTLQDYKRSGFDRGHLAPAADMNFSEESMYDSFVLSNMSPQRPEFNRGIWSSLESTVRNFAATEGVIYVTTGPILDDTKNYKTIGKNKVTVPNYYYKAILKLGNEPKAIGFVLPNAKGKENLKRYAKSIDDIENLTNLDLFANVDDDIEEKIESKFDVSKWSFKEFNKGDKISNIKVKSNSKLGKIRSINNKLIDSIINLLH